jgi:uncharacterized protein (TIGR02186 family)
MREPLRFLLLCLLVSLFKQPLLPAQNPDPSSTMAVSPELISINALYKGTDVSIRADLPGACDGAVVKIQGADHDEVLSRKGKVSIIWMNVDEVTVSNAPGIYILNSSGPLDRICAPEEQNRLMLGYDALQERIVIRGKKGSAGSDFSEFIMLKEHSGSYQRSATGRLIQDAAGKTAFEAVLHVPPVMPSGDYQIQLYCFKNLVLLGQSSASLRVEKVGVPNYLYSLAFDHPAAYGLLAIVIAMATGIVMGTVFGSRNRRKQ